jgi:hypothetical protein
VIEPLLDDLSFQLQYPVQVFQLELLDVTPPVGEGMEREMLLFPLPQGYPSPKFLRSNSFDIQTSFSPALSPHIGSLSGKPRAALRWYVKGLAAPYETDKFAFFWIALEILCSQSTIVVEKPYVAACGHEIPQCPVCDKSTSRFVNGETIRRFIVEVLGASEASAKELWRMRQMFHGANDLTPQATEELPRHVLALRSLTATALKDALGLARASLPIITGAGPTINQAFYIGGRRKVDEFDLRT